MEEVLFFTCVCVCASDGFGGGAFVLLSLFHKGVRGKRNNIRDDIRGRKEEGRETFDGEELKCWRRKRERTKEEEERGRKGD